jgi:hypothetical protein
MKVVKVMKVVDVVEGAAACAVLTRLAREWYESRAHSG